MPSCCNAMSVLMVVVNNIHHGSYTPDLILVLSCHGLWSQSPHVCSVPSGVRRGPERIVRPVTWRLKCSILRSMIEILHDPICTIRPSFPRFWYLRLCRMSIINSRISHVGTSATSSPLPEAPKYAKSCPFRHFVEALGHYFTYLWGPGRCDVGRWCKQPELV